MQEQNRKISHKQARQEGLIKQGSENLFGDSNPVSHVGVEFSVDKRLFSFCVTQYTATCLLKSTWRFYYIQRIYVKENPSVDWV